MGGMGWAWHYHQLVGGAGVGCMGNIIRLVGVAEARDQACALVGGVCLMEVFV